MLKRLLASKPAVASVSALIAWYVKLVYATSKVIREPADTEARLFADHPQILALWHGQFLLLPKLKPEKRPVNAVISRHGDGELAAAVLERFGIDLVGGCGLAAARPRRGHGVA